MSIVYSADCPVCKAKDDMQIDSSEAWVTLQCFSCGYGNHMTLGKTRDGLEYYQWDGRRARRKYAKFMGITERHKLPFVGRVLFYPQPIVGESEYGIYPGSRQGKLVWKLYVMKRYRRAKHLGTYRRFADADEAGSQHIGYRIGSIVTK